MGVFKLILIWQAWIWYVVIGGERQYRVVYKNEPYGCPGWYIEFRGMGAGPFWGWLNITPYPTEDEARNAAFRYAKANQGAVVWK